MKNIRFSLLLIFNTYILSIFVPGTVLAQTDEEFNNALQVQVGITLRSVMDVWINIAAASMVLVIIAGAAMLVTSGTDHNMRVAGKNTVLGAGITITLLYSLYVIVALILSIFDITIFT